MQNSSKGNNSWKNHRTRTRRWYAHPPSILNIPMKFQWNPTSSFREFAWTRTVPYIFMQNSSKGNNSWKNHRTRTRRWYAHPPLILNIPMKFHWNPTSSFREFAWTRAGRTHGRTDARTHGRTDARTKRRLYAPPKFFGEHNKSFHWTAMKSLGQWCPTRSMLKMRLRSAYRLWRYNWLKVWTDDRWQTDGQMDDRQMTDNRQWMAYHPISSPEAFGPGELKTVKQ